MGFRRVPVPSKGRGAEAPGSDVPQNGPGHQVSAHRLEGPWGHLRGGTRRGTSTFPTAHGAGAILSSIRTRVGVDSSPSQHPRTRRVAQIRPPQRAEGTGGLEEQRNGHTPLVQEEGTRRARCHPGRARPLPRSLGTRRADGAWGDGGSAGGAGKVAFPAQTRQGNKIFGIRRDFQITTLKTQVR